MRSLSAKQNSEDAITMDLEELRKQIDAIDDELLAVLEKRFAVSLQIGELKKENKQEIFDEKREEKLLQTIKEKAVKKNIDPEFINEIYASILSYSRKKQQK